MTEPPDYVAEYLQLVMDGARPGDPRLFALFEQMTPQEVRRVKEGLIAEYVRTLPPAPTNSGAPCSISATCTSSSFAAARGPMTRRTQAASMDMMSDEELARSKAAIAELWLMAEPPPARPN